VLPEHTKRDTQALFPGQAILASTARQAGVEDDLGPELDALDPVSHRVNDSGAIGATDVWQTDWNAGHAVEDEKIEMVEGCCFQPNPHFARPRCRIGAITVEEFFGPTVFLEIEGFH
jgi:hypothetical protein